MGPDKNEQGFSEQTGDDTRYLDQTYGEAIPTTYDSPSSETMTSSYEASGICDVLPDWFPGCSDEQPDQPFCFATRLGSYKTLAGKDADDAEKRASRNIIYAPVDYVHDGNCHHEDGSILEFPND
jgi:hypothetical protein